MLNKQGPRPLLQEVVMVKKRELLPAPLSRGSGLVYPYSAELMDSLKRTDRYGEEYSLGRLIGAGVSQRIIAPRNLPHAHSAETVTTVAEGLDYKFKSSFVARDERQEAFVQSIAAYLKEGRNFIAQAPTGFGKTVCTLEAIARVGKVTVIVVTKEDLRDQWAAQAKTLLGLEYGKGLGLVQGDTFQVANCGIVIAMIHTLSREGKFDPSQFKFAGLSVWDEVHRVGADNFSQSAYKLPAKLRLGVSATPDRKDGKLEVIRAHIGPVLVAEHTTTLTPRIIARRSTWSCPLIRKVDKATGKVTLVELPHAAGRLGQILSLITAYHERNLMIANFVGSAYRKGRMVLVQSDRREHLENLMSICGSYGVPPGDMAYYVGGMSEGEKELSKTKKVLFATYQMTSEGTNIPELDTLVMATPRSDVVQIVGRILREHPSKKDPVVFDVVDTSSVLNGYWKSRLRYYEEIGAEVQL